MIPINHLKIHLLIWFKEKRRENELNHSIPSKLISFKLSQTFARIIANEKKWNKIEKFLNIIEND